MTSDQFATHFSNFVGNNSSSCALDSARNCSLTSATEIVAPAIGAVKFIAQIYKTSAKLLMGSKAAIDA